MKQAKNPQWVKISVEVMADGALCVIARFRGEVVTGVCSCGDERCAFHLALDATCAVIRCAYPGAAPDVSVGAKWGKRVLFPALPLSGPLGEFLAHGPAPEPVDPDVRVH